MLRFSYNNEDTGQFNEGTFDQNKNKKGNVKKRD